MSILSADKISRDKKKTRFNATNKQKATRVKSTLEKKLHFNGFN